MKFSKDNFNKNATRAIKKMVSNHLDILNGMEVIFNEEFGEIEYTVGGEEFCLYPIYRNWCEE